MVNVLKPSSNIKGSVQEAILDVIPVKIGYLPANLRSLCSPSVSQVLWLLRCLEFSATFAIA